MADDAFPAALPQEEEAKWNSLTANQRSRAAQRLKAILAWDSGEVTASQAVIQSGLSRSRFYRLAAEWRAKPSLEALGAQIGVGGRHTRLDPEVINKLQAVVSGVVKVNDGASVSELVRHLVKASSVPEDKLPGVIRLRSIVEDELRRLKAGGEAGNAVRFDCCATNLPRDDERPHILFLCMDAGTRLVFGAAVGSVADIGEGYGEAARDALRRLKEELPDLPWALQLARMEMIAGIDLAASEDLQARLDQAVRANVQLKRKEKRYGTYIRDIVGPRLGRIEITPKQTEVGLALPANGNMTPWSVNQVRVEVANVIKTYNAKILKSLPPAHGRMPEDLASVLKILALGSEVV